MHLLLFTVFSSSRGSLGDGGSIPGRVGVGRHQVCFRFLLCIEHCDIMEEFRSFAKKTWGELSGGGWWRTVNTAMWGAPWGFTRWGLGHRRPAAHPACPHERCPWARRSGRARSHLPERLPALWSPCGGVVLAVWVGRAEGDLGAGGLTSETVFSAET